MHCYNIDQVDLLDEYDVTGIITKGDSSTDEYVTSFTLSYKHLGIWTSLVEGGGVDKVIH